MKDDPKPTREEIARALVEELGVTPEAAAHLAGMHEDVIEVGEEMDTTAGGDEKGNT